MSRPRKPKREQSDLRAIEKPPPDYSDPAARQSLKDTVKGILGVDVPEDDPCFNSSPEQDAARAGLAGVARQNSIDRLRVDPKGDEPLAPVLASVLLDRSDSFDEKLVGKMFVTVLRNPDPAVAEQFFRRVMALKMNAAQPHRNSYAYYAYARFIEETDREPSKPELRAYIEARREEFKDAPGPDDKQGWTRLWKESGLSNLADKVGTKP